jgi:hypothetical protein
MSLVGSLEDLGLGDILQIISLSRKSGVLSLRSELGEGQIVFRDGRVVGAFCKGGPTDLRSLLVADGAVSDRDFAAAARAARDAGDDVTQQLHGLGILPRARLDELRQRHVERSAFTMFSWPTGEFSFDVCDAADGFDAALCVEPGLDVQYLAMEGARLRDEESRDAPPRVDRQDPASFADLGEELRSEPAPSPDEPAFEGVVEPLGDDEDVLELDALAEPLDGDAEADTVVIEGPDTLAIDADAQAGFGFGADEELGLPDASEPLAPVAAPEIALPAAPAQPAAAAAGGGRAALPVVVVDPDLVVLEWVKASLRDGFERVHIFQKTELAIARIRQYLVRRTTPLVVISERAPADPVTGAANAAEIVRRLKAQSQRMTVLWLGADGAGGAPADGCVARPPDADLHDPRRGARLKQLGETLARDLAARARAPEPGTTAPPAAAAPRAKGRLVQASAELREAVSRGQIIPVVMRFAAEHFTRVALFLVRDELAVGMAQLGLGSAGGPDDAALRDLAIPAAEPAWFRRVFEQRSSVRGPIGDPGDRALVRLLGTAEPTEAYVAPLETGDRVVALLYADNLPANGPLPDTEALEVILHEAGLALDRAALERQLAEFETE